MAGVNTTFIGLETGITELNGLTGAVDITSPDGSVTVTVDGQDIELSATPVAVPYAMLSDVKSTGTSGGTFTSGAYRTRVLNTEYDPEGIVTLDTGTNRFTLTEGTYKISATAPSSLVGGNISKMFNITDAADALLGSTGRGDADEAEVTVSFIRGEITIADTKEFEIQHICQVTNANGFGFPANLGSQTELYTVVEIWKVG